MKNKGKIKIRRKVKKIKIRKGKTIENWLSRKIWTEARENSEKSENMETGLWKPSNVAPIILRKVSTF